MFLSMCISFLLARSVRRKLSYVLLLIPIILFMSFFSAHYVDRFRYWLGPFSLSFPFYTDTFVESPTPFPFLFATHHGLYFLGWRISSFTLPLQLGTLAFLTSFFLLVNLVGAMLGYWINKRLPEESLKRDMFDFFFKFGIWSFLLFTGSTWIFPVLFWTFTVIATTIYGIYKWMGMRKERIS